MALFGEFSSVFEAQIRCTLGYFLRLRRKNGWVR